MFPSAVCSSSPASSISDSWAERWWEPFEPSRCVKLAISRGARDESRGTHWFLTGRDADGIAQLAWGLYVLWCGKNLQIGMWRKVLRSNWFAFHQMRVLGRSMRERKNLEPDKTTMFAPELAFGVMQIVVHHWECTYVLGVNWLAF